MLQLFHVVTYRTIFFRQRVFVTKDKIPRRFGNITKHTRSCVALVRETLATNLSRRIIPDCSIAAADSIRHWFTLAVPTPLRAEARDRGWRRQGRNDRALPRETAKVRSCGRKVGRYRRVAFHGGGNERVGKRLSLAIFQLTP